MSENATFTARDAKNHFGEVLDAAQRSPVSITKNGREVAVLMSRKEFEIFQKMDDYVWAMRAKDAHENGGYLGTKKSEDYINSVLNAGA